MGDNGEESENDPVESDFETAESDSVSHDIVLTMLRYCTEQSLCVTFEPVHMAKVPSQMPCM